MRSAAQYAEKWMYVRYNPIRHGLVQDLDAWPFQDELMTIEW